MEKTQKPQFEPTLFAEPLNPKINATVQSLMFSTDPSVGHVSHDRLVALGLAGRPGRGAVLRNAIQYNNNIPTTHDEDFRRSDIILSAIRTVAKSIRSKELKNLFTVLYTCISYQLFINIELGVYINAN